MHHTPKVLRLALIALTIATGIGAVQACSPPSGPGGGGVNPTIPWPPPTLGPLPTIGI